MSRPVVISGSRITNDEPLHPPEATRCPTSASQQPRLIVIGERRNVLAAGEAGSKRAGLDDLEKAADLRLDIEARGITGELPAADIGAHFARRQKAALDRHSVMPARFASREPPCRRFRRRLGR